jgi:hypothetical protein
VWHALLRDSRFFETLLRFDQDLAARVRRAGCPCGGRLDSARYPRKPRGGPPGLGPEHERRLSFCCARDGCRGRATPPSVRFLGRRVYFGSVVVLVSALQHGLSPRRVARLREQVGVDRRTLVRWRRWWAEAFPRSAFWRGARGRFAAPVDVPRLPGSLLERFEEGPAAARLVAVLTFLAPLSRPRNARGG